VAGKQERQRKLARERHERRLAREAQRQANARKTAKIVGSSLAIVVIGAVVVVGVIALTNNKSTTKPLSNPITTPAVTPSATPTPTATPVAEPAHSCTYIPGAPAVRKVGYPPAKPDYKASYQATINTNRGAIVIDLLNSKATCTVNSFVYLAEKGFYNNTPCPRLVTSGIFVLQCGDPTGTGTGGPGYAFASENLTGATYTPGTMAMANSGTPDSNGSQFFFVFKNTPLPPSYTPFGKIVAGLNILQQIAKQGIVPPMNPAGGGHPKHVVNIQTVTIKKT
jgi:peptidyl-prolyl cis-trans isomerase B (cyclophilin B)